MLPGSRVNVRSRTVDEKGARHACRSGRPGAFDPAGRRRPPVPNRRLAAEPRRVRRHDLDVIGDSPTTSPACTCATPRTRCTTRSAATTRSTATGWCTRALPRRPRRLPQPLRAHRRLRGRAGGGRAAVGRARRAAGAVAARRRLGRARPDEGRVEHRRRRAQRPRAHELLSVRRPLRARPGHAGATRARDLERRFPRRRASRRTPRSTSTPARCCSSTTRRVRRTCTTASSTPHERAGALRSTCRCPARACRTTWRSPSNYAILNDCPLFWDPELLAHGMYAARFHPDMPTRFAVDPAPRTAPPTSVGSRPTDLRPALDQRVRGRRRGRARRLLPGRPAPKHATAARAARADVPLPRPRPLQTRPHRWRFNLATGATKEEDAVRPRSWSSA